MPDAPIPGDLVDLQRAVHTAQAATRIASDADRGDAREAERAAVLALHRHPARAATDWKALREAALAGDTTPPAT